MSFRNSTVPFRPSRRRTIAVAAATTAALALGAATAEAHTEVAKTSPAAGKTASTSVRTVLITFTGQIRRGTVRVTGPGGKLVSQGSGGADPRNVKRLRGSLKSGLKAGGYTVRWTIVAVDGHEQKGTFGFRLKSR